MAHAAGFAEAAAARSEQPWRPERFLDLGSGGGLPGLVVAAQLPASEGVLLDGRTERARLLEGHVVALGWGRRLRVCALRAELAGRLAELRGAFDLVVARGFAPPAVTAECAAPFLRPGGLLVVSEPPESGDDRWPANALAIVGLSPLGQALAVRDGSRFQVLRQDLPCPERWPRRTGIPAKRPLFPDPSYRERPAAAE